MSMKYSHNSISLARLVSACYCRIVIARAKSPIYSTEIQTPRCPAVVDDAQISHKKVQKRKRFSRVRNFSILYGPPIGTLMTFAHTFPRSHLSGPIREYWKIRFGITQSRIDPESSGHHSNRMVCVGELKR